MSLAYIYIGDEAEAYDNEITLLLQGQSLDTGAYVDFSEITLTQISVDFGITEIDSEAEDSGPIQWEVNSDGDLEVTLVLSEEVVDAGLAPGIYNASIILYSADWPNGYFWGKQEFMIQVI